MEKEIVEKYLISKEDAEEYFNNRSIIKMEEIQEYYRRKGIKTSRLFPDLVSDNFKKL
jgi:hypothetical protein